MPATLRALIGALLLATATFAQDTLRVSVDSSGGQGNDSSGEYGVNAISADGRFVAFQSDASNLVPFDTNHCSDVFMHDRATGVTERVSVDSSGAEGIATSQLPSISADGQLVAFVSDASNLVANDTNGCADIFVHDRSTGVTEIVSVDSSGVVANFASSMPRIAADGRVVAFSSDASNLVVGDANGWMDTFVHDRVTGITERVSVSSSGVEGNQRSVPSQQPALSADGQIVAFASYASNLVVGDHNAVTDIFVRDRSTGTTSRVSVRSDGLESNADSYSSALSADGEFVAFSSAASNLVSGDTNGFSDIFVCDRSTGIVERVSVSPSGVEANEDSQMPSLSADGQLVGFASYARNLVPKDRNFFADFFVHDRATGGNVRASVDSAGAEANDETLLGQISADGLMVDFCTRATDLVANDTNSRGDVFTHELCATPASWSNYGAGFPGTLGVPAFTARSNPAFETTLTLDLANSYGAFTIGLLFVGFQPTSIHSNWGGDLLVVPSLTVVVGLQAGGIALSGDIPDDRTLCGLSIDLQAIESDPGAAKGVSFTAGLELVLGR